MQDNSPRLEGTTLADFEPRDHVDELEIIDVTAGDGQEAAQGSTVTAHYTGALCKDGTIFQSSKDMGRPISFSLAQVIQGWQLGVPGMKVGGTRRLIIPAKLAYGSQSPSHNIPADSDLVFDIELADVN